MNQILSTQGIQNKENRENRKTKIKNNHGGNHPDIMKRAVIVFSILLICFSVTIISVKIAQISKDKKADSKIGELNKPEIAIQKIEADKVYVKVSYDEEIAKFSWWWNDDISQIQEKNYNVQSVSIDIPEGEINVLHVKVTGKDGSTNELTQTLERDLSITIEWNQIPETDTMEIVARAENGIEKIVYYWNEESPVTVLATEENQEEMKTTIQLQRGTNTLHTIVTDLEGNAEEKEQILQCVKEPVIDVQISLDQMLIVAKVTHDMGFEKVEFTANGQTVVYDEDYNGYNKDRTKLTFKAQLVPGMDNIVLIEAYSNEKMNEDENTHASFAGHKDLTQMTVENNGNT